MTHHLAALLATLALVATLVAAVHLALSGLDGLSIGGTR